jgi:hypothetical protein
LADEERRGKNAPLICVDAAQSFIMGYHATAVKDKGQARFAAASPPLSLPLRVVVDHHGLRG